MDVLFSRLHWIMVTRLKAPPLIDGQEMLTGRLNEPGPAETGSYSPWAYIATLPSQALSKTLTHLRCDKPKERGGRGPWAHYHRAERPLFLAIYDVFDRVFRVIEALLKS